MINFIKKKSQRELVIVFSLTLTLNVAGGNNPRMHLNGRHGNHFHPCHSTRQVVAKLALKKFLIWLNRWKWRHAYINVICIKISLSHCLNHHNQSIMMKKFEYIKFVNIKTTVHINLIETVGIIICSSFFGYSDILKLTN